MSDDFVAQIGALRLLGHELRTPLTLLQGYASLLQDDELPPEQRRAACGLIRKQCAEMNRLIDSFLDERSEQVHLALASLRSSGSGATEAKTVRPTRRGQLASR